MIEIVKGKLLAQKPTYLIIENGATGIGVHVPVSTGQKFSQIGEDVYLFTHTHVQMNARSGDTTLALYGFCREVEKDVFLLLIGISGIGPKGALRILSETSPEDLAGMVATGDANALTKLKGIGKKTAEVLLPQLKNAFDKIDLDSDGFMPSLAPSGPAQEAVLALMSLGVKEGPAVKAVDKAVKALGEESSTTVLIPEALKYT